MFSLIQNDHITHRVLHVQLVSKIARTIGRFLHLNEDLIEAVALGHDIGHAPFGHEGERALSDLCEQAGIGAFLHNVQSVRFLDVLEKKGKGWNLCLQTLDGILCHNGEIHDRRLSPSRDRTFHDLDAKMGRMTATGIADSAPMTLEGCVVRLADTVAYVGRDIEDAIRLSVVKRSDIPENCARVLGSTNGTMVYNLVTDMIVNSAGKSRVGFSPEVFSALGELKNFNYRRIYLNPVIRSHVDEVRELFIRLFETFVSDIEGKNTDSPVFTRFLEGMPASYPEKSRPAEIARDFIAGMTDRYFLSFCPEKKRPRPVRLGKQDAIHR